MLWLINAPINLYQSFLIAFFLYLCSCLLIFYKDLYFIDVAREKRWQSLEFPIFFPLKVLTSFYLQK